MSTTPITMKLANASEQDVDTAIALGAILDDLDNCNHPLRSSFIRDENSEWPEDDPDAFDPENGEHGKILAARLLKLLARRPGCLNRVIWGFSTARYNDVFDKDSDHLKLHPRLETALEKAAKADGLQDTLNRSKDALAWFIQQCQGDSGTGESHWQQFPEYRAAQATLATLQQS